MTTQKNRRIETFIQAFEDCNVIQTALDPSRATNRRALVSDKILAGGSFGKCLAPNLFLQLRHRNCELGSFRLPRNADPAVHARRLGAHRKSSRPFPDRFAGFVAGIAAWQKRLATTILFAGTSLPRGSAAWLDGAGLDATGLNFHSSFIPMWIGHFTEWLRVPYC